ncbi:FtsW/RodA/SpoVE family cell cycle protein [Rossellomorea vietnamensis]|uniref:FtsW/RodA/SpoVE family cell cycle protein n=1 Tax=Rossellomorea vietnamensis TaxID=218284 RepID=A0A6I6UNS5_9BACI|nr:FtsW/RodA/SpoVE family cell cycle protein [Rossellomorea vietnamensis]QHE60333.1 FtsW/RodA/SpoVE family cell cycle protein [Rossellomorea vietnamensis]
MKEPRGDFLNRVIRQVKSREAKQFVADELHHHLEEEIKSLKKAGMDEAAAEDKAIKHMGSAERLGMEMNKLHRPRVDWVMIGLVLLISSIGVLPSMHVSTELYNDNGFLLREITYLLIGIFISTLLMLFDYRKLRVFRWWIYGGTAFILIVLMFFPSTYINGEAHFKIASFTIDSTAAVTALVLSWVTYLGNAKVASGWVLPFVVVSLCSLMMLPSLPAVFVFTLTLTALLWGRFKEKRKVIVWAYAFIGALIGIMIFNAQSYQLARLYAFIRPEENRMIHGYMYFHNQELLARGGWFGVQGGTEMINEGHTNFALTTITYYYGWITGGAIILIGLFIMYRMLRHIRSIKEPLGQAIILGGVTLFSTQFLYNVGMTMGFLPHTGMFLPFVSYGLNPTIQTFIIVGLFLSVYRKKSIMSYGKEAMGKSQRDRSPGSK